MAKFDSQYPEQIAPEENDKLLIASGQDGNIMSLRYSTLISQIQHDLDIVDNELSESSIHPVQNKTIYSALQRITTGLTHLITGFTYDEEKKSFSEGELASATGYASHAENNGTVSSGANAHAEGYATTASGNQSHAEGNQTSATAAQAHAEGWGTSATNNGAHAEGDETIASGRYSHSEGESTTASGNYSHAEGLNNTAPNTAHHVCGKNATIDHTGKVIFQIGVGSSTNNRADAIVVTTDGNVFLKAHGGDVVLQSDNGGQVSIGDNVVINGSEIELNQAIYIDSDRSGHSTQVYLDGIGGYVGSSLNISTSKSLQTVLGNLESRISDIESAMEGDITYAEALAILNNE